MNNFVDSQRDLKPSNIPLAENMTPKILDFGLAQIDKANQDEGSTNRIVGDIYILGVMILEIVAAKIRAHALAALELRAFSLHEAQ
ncbi:receptor-like kinase [Medicago truncatula]|uniref:Receptor-like kinase n=1 Tax=Medicago truncatula TaxID=3880 RepID=G7JYQ9_MEDTR|nr:receptor-like kinase [Medicago truncatula]